MQTSFTETWSWRYEDSSGRELADEKLPVARFPSRADAESWVGESWRELLDNGVDAVSLLHEQEVVFRMSLHPPEH